MVFVLCELFHFVVCVVCVLCVTAGCALLAIQYTTHHADFVLDPERVCRVVCVLFCIIVCVLVVLLLCLHCVCIVSLLV